MNTQLSLIKIDGLKTTTIGIEKFPTTFSFEDGIKALKQIAQGDSFLRWIIGDILNHMMHKFCLRDPGTGQFKSKEQSERAKLIMEATNLSTSTLNDCSNVAFAFTVTRRRDTVSWSHHRELCALDKIVQDKWLNRCEIEKLSTRDLRTLIAEQSGEREAQQPSLFTDFNLIKTINELVRGLTQLEQEKPLESWPIAFAKKMLEDLEEPYKSLSLLRTRLEDVLSK